MYDLLLELQQLTNRLIIANSWFEHIFLLNHISSQQIYTHAMIWIRIRAWKLSYSGKILFDGYYMKLHYTIKQPQREEQGYRKNSSFRFIRHWHMKRLYSHDGFLCSYFDVIRRHIIAIFFSFISSSKNPFPGAKDMEPTTSNKSRVNLAVNLLFKK